MCRSIKKLRNPEAPAEPEDIEAAALQFVRKVSGFQRPAERNREAFDSAVQDIARVTGDLLARLEALRSGARRPGG